MPEDDPATPVTDDRPPRPAWLTRRLPRVLLVGVVVLLLIQLVPIRVKNHPVSAEPNWDSAQTRTLAVRACFDCHSNQTQKTWYENIAPISWWITNHVDEGRAALNFSTCGQSRQERSDDLAEVVTDGSMPPSTYTMFGLHADAKLTSAERQLLAAGLQATAPRGCQPAVP